MGAGPPAGRLRKGSVEHTQTPGAASPTQRCSVSSTRSTLQARPLPGVEASASASAAGSGENARPTQLAAGTRWVEALCSTHTRRLCSTLASSVPVPWRAESCSATASTALSVAPPLPTTVFRVSHGAAGVGCGSGTASRMVFVSTPGSEPSSRRCCSSAWKAWAWPAVSAVTATTSQQNPMVVEPRARRPALLARGVLAAAPLRAPFSPPEISRTQVLSAGGAAPSSGDFCRPPSLRRRGAGSHAR